VISPWVLHRHVRRWSQPDAFDPERFLRDETPPRLSYMPFGAGPRVCVGAQFGLAEVVLVLAMFVKEFEFQLASTRQVMPAAVVSMTPDHQVPFHIRKK
jgi:unspecific monooxygenase